ncbi:MAG TPA: hypothetical protein VES73_07435 [Lamprocystis sp. (in: g-proteobacteria)]|nr:hypothetical protein [Lamprocystis sp. (in: g-proteobacteria)]
MIFLGAALLLVPGILSLLLPSLSGTSRIELRAPQPFPGIPRNLSAFYTWPQRFDQFSSDQFPLREDIIRWSSRALRRLNVSISPEVLIGKDGWLFLRRSSDVLDESRGVRRLPGWAVTNWVDRYVERQRQLSDRGIRTLLAIVPNKHTVYPQFLNPYFFKVGETITDQIVEGLRGRGVAGLIDLRPALLAAAGTGLVYDRLDTHWNDRGAWAGYEAILRQIPDARALSTDQLQWSEVVRSGDLARLIGDTGLTESTTDAQLRVSRISKRINFAEKERYEQTPWSAETNLDAGPRVIFFCDSFTNERLYKFLEASFPRSVFKHHNGMILDDPLINAERPDLVVYIIVERLLPDVLPD